MSIPFPASLACMLAAAVLAGSCAQAAPLERAGAPAAKGLQTVCRQILGVETGEAHGVGCVQALSRSAARLEEERRLGDADDACLARGLRPGAGDFALCVLTSADSAGSAADDPPPALTGLAVPGGRRSFAMASNADRRARERLACAAVGLNPAGRAFDACVADLASTMFALDNPQP